MDKLDYNREFIIRLDKKKAYHSSGANEKNIKKNITWHFRNGNDLCATLLNFFLDGFSCRPCSSDTIVFSWLCYVFIKLRGNCSHAGDRHNIPVTWYPMEKQQYIPLPYPFHCILPLME